MVLSQDRTGWMRARPTTARPRAPFQAIALSPSGVMVMTSAVSADVVAARRPHGRANENMPNTNSACCTIPTVRSTPNVEPNTL